MCEFRPGRAALKVCVLLLTAVSIRADDPQAADLKRLSLEELSQIEVTSVSRNPTPAFRTPAAVYVITGEDIRRSGARTIPDALRLAPGIEVAQIDGSKWSVGIRGFGTRLSRSVLVLIDGRSVYTTLFAGTYWEVQDTLLEDIDRIEVIRGPGGTIWGPNAVNGVINIITKSTRETRGTFAETGGGNTDQGFVNFRYGAGKDNGLTYRVYGKAYTRGPERHFDRDNFDDWRGAQTGFRMDWSRGSRDKFTLQGDLYKQEDGERVTVSTYVPPSNQNVDGNADLSGGNVLFRWNRTCSERNEFELQTFYDRTNRFEPNFGENRDTFDIDLLARSRLTDRQQLRYGLGARASDGRFKETASGLVFDPANVTDYLFSGFIEDDIDLIRNKLTLSAGTKILRTNFTDFEFEPNLTLMLTTSDRQSMWASFTHAVRTPSRGDEDFYLSSFLGVSGGLEFFARFNANPNFAPEQLNGYEIGYRRLLGKGFYLDFAGYFNHYHDLFSQDLAGPIGLETTLPFPEPVQPPQHLLLPAQFRNDLLGLTTGAEIAPEWRPTTFWRLRGSYSFLHMDLKKNGPVALGGTPETITGASPQHEIQIQSAFDLGKRFQADFIYRFVSALPAQSVSAYSTGDVRVSWRATPHVEFSVAGQNLLQPFHVEYVGDPGGPVAIRRNVYASLVWR